VSPASSTRRELLVLLAAAALLLTANMERLSLQALDDCFYARKGVEMARSGAFYTVTWNGALTTQNPPLQFWLLGRCFRLLGENDLAARLPSVIMALGILVVTFHVGRRLLGPSRALTGTALLLASPFFVNNARRCMMEIPLLFWVVLALALVVEGYERPWLHALIALPLGAALLTKSVLGFFPLVVTLPAALLTPAGRRSLRRPWLWIGALGGTAIGASWIIHQWLRFGERAVLEHFGREVLGRSLSSLSLVRWVTDYPKVLVESYEPVAPLAVGGAVLLWRAWRAKRNDPAILLAVWAFLPVLVYSLSAARSPRYLFPILPGLALCGGVLVEHSWPRAAAFLRRALVPAVAVAAATLFWLAPTLLGGQGTAVFKDQGQPFAEGVPPDEPLAYFGSNYWGLANPLLYYTGTQLEQSAATLEECLARARSRRSGLALVDRKAWEGQAGPPRAATVVMEDSGWLLLDVREPGA